MTDLGLGAFGMELLVGASGVVAKFRLVRSCLWVSGVAA